MNEIFSNSNIRIFSTLRRLERYTERSQYESFKLKRRDEARERFVVQHQNLKRQLEKQEDIERLLAIFQCFKVSIDKGFFFSSGKTELDSVAMGELKVQFRMMLKIISEELRDPSKDENVFLGLLKSSRVLDTFGVFAVRNVHFHLET